MNRRFSKRNVVCCLRSQNQSRMAEDGDTSGMRKLEGVFATGHTFFPQHECKFYEQMLHHEFTEEYKKVHSIGHSNEIFSPTLHPSMTKRRGPIDVPYSETTQISRHIACGRPPRNPSLMSSNEIGGWWNDPLYNPKNLQSLPTAIPGKKEIGLGMRTSGEIGRFWSERNDKDLFPQPPKAELSNNRQRILEDGTNSSFCLEKLPIADRLL